MFKDDNFSLVLNDHDPRWNRTKTFTYLSKGQTGDAGAVFRDPAQSKDLRKRIKDAEASAEKSCFVK